MSEETVQQKLAELDPDIAAWVSTQWRTFVENREFHETPDLAKCYPTLPLAWGASEFIAKTCVAQPRLLADLAVSGDLFRHYDTKELRHRILALQSSDLPRSLRQVRVREAVRLAWRDIAGWADLNELMATMSELADACVERALRYVYQSGCDRLGTPLARSDGAQVGMTVLGLGKLGGGELNFSSDIDLIFAYSETGQTKHARPISNHEFFLKMARELIRVLDEPTSDGVVFRVDMRLRPNGQSGPLALSFDAIEQYYQTHGRDWERYALIKARNIAGDRAAGEELLAKLKPFVYRRYLDYGAFEAVRAMKGMINRELRRKGVQNNIKLGQGGIREIEFIAQSFQLIRGGREPLLQTNRLIEALQYLGHTGIIDDKASRNLIDAYAFLRKLEHRLQMIRDQQTHHIPGAELDRKRLLVATGIEDWSSLTQEIADTTDCVHRNFDQIFVPVQLAEPAEADEIEDLWQNLLDRSVADSALLRLGYVDASAAMEGIESLRASRAYHAHSKYGRERLDRLMPMFIREAGHSPDPDETLHRLIQFIEGVGRRSAYLVLLIENPLALSQLVKLIGASAWISSWIRRHPLLLDELLDPISATVAGSSEHIIDELQQRLANVEADDLEQQMEILREVRHGQSLRVAAADVSGLIDWVEVGKRLSMVAEITLAQTVELCATSLYPNLGRPSVQAGFAEAMLGVVAYGKLGSMELGYNSDLDIVFLHHGARTGGATEGGARSIDNEQYYSRLVQRVIHALTTRTAAGVLYEVDMRLRPSGRAGPVVTSMEGFHNYQINKAWTWEHQAIVRARMIIGPESLRARLEDTRREVLCQPRDVAALKHDISDMRSKMRAAHDKSVRHQFDLKHGRGGIVDIEFIVQYCVLRWAREHPDLLTPRNNIELIETMRHAGIMSSGEGDPLAAAYHAYLTTEHSAKLAEQQPLVDATEFTGHRRHVEMLWQRLFE